MEKELERDLTGKKANIGCVKIADDVVSMIAGIAAKEVEGVAGLTGNVTRDFMNKMGMKNQTSGVRVEVLGKAVRVDVSIVMEYGYNIPATSGKVQEKVKTAIENMTCLEVADVNVRISDIAIATV